jgi:hypothetical protein
MDRDRILPNTSVLEVPPLWPSMADHVYCRVFSTNMVIRISFIRVEGMAVAEISYRFVRDTHNGTFV